MSFLFGSSSTPSPAPVVNPFLGLEAKTVTSGKYVHSRRDKSHLDHLKDFTNKDNLTTCIDVYRNSVPTLFDYVKDENKGYDDRSVIMKSDKYDFSKSFTSSVVTERTFKERLNKLTKNIFNFMDWDNVVMAGGAVSMALSHIPLAEAEKIDFDVDFFMYGVDESRAMRIFNKIYESFSSLVPDHKCVRTKHSITVVLPLPYRHVQFVLKLYQSKEDILNSIDLQSCKVLYDGEKVWTSVDGHFALVNQVNIFKPKFDANNYKSRIYKYARRGFGILVPGLDKTRLSSHIYRKVKYAGIDGQDSFGKEIDVLVDLLRYENSKSLTEDQKAKVNPKTSDYASYAYGKTLAKYRSKPSRRQQGSRGAKTRKQYDPYSPYNNTYKFFDRKSTVQEVLDGLHRASQSVLRSYKLKSTSLSKEDKKLRMKYHNLAKFPIYMVFDNVGKALVHENGYDPKIENHFFMNGPTFGHSVLYKNLNTDEARQLSEEGLVKQNEEYDSYVTRHYVVEFDLNKVYYLESTDVNIQHILNGTFTDEMKATLTEENVSFRNRNGQTYLQACVLVNNVDLAKHLLTLKCNLLDRLENGATCVHLSVKKGLMEMTELFLEHLVETDNKSNRVYDNNMCNYTHYALMYSTLDMFKLVTRTLDTKLGDISWNVKLKDPLPTGRRQKYFCCSKFCMLYKRLDILEYVLGMYKDFNDFRYMFVDSDLSTINSCNVLGHAIQKRYDGFLLTLLNFFKDRDIDIVLDQTKINNIPANATDEATLKTLFTLEKFVQGTDKVPNNTTLSQRVVSVLVKMFNDGKYTKMLKYIDTYVPTVWTSQQYSGIHTQINLTNIFGIKYVDTEKAIRLFSYIKSENWEGVESLVPKLQYNLYIVDETNHRTVLNFCRGKHVENVEQGANRLRKLLTYIAPVQYNKTQTGSKKLHSLIFVNHSIMFHHQLVRVMLENEDHHETVQKHIFKYFHKMLKDSWDNLISNAKITYENVTTYDFANFTELLKLFTEYKCELNTELVKLSSNSGTRYSTSRALDVKACDEVETLSISLDMLKQFCEALESVKDVCREDLYEVFDKKNLDVEGFIKCFYNQDSFNELLEAYPDVLNQYNLMDKKYGRWAYFRSSKWFTERVCDHYYQKDSPHEYNLLEAYGSNAVRYLRQKELFAHYLSQMDLEKNWALFKKILGNNGNGFTEWTLVDVKGNTPLHVIAKLNPEFYNVVIKRNDFDLDTLRDSLKTLYNREGKTPLDYVEDTVNDVVRFNPQQFTDLHDLYLTLRG